MTPYEAACAAIDKANALDPRNHEAPYSRKMVEWVKRLAPGASEDLLLAARSQHIRRWMIPRSNYPNGRKGYLAWREALKRFHADTVAEIMKDAGCGAPSIVKVRTLLVRKNSADDPEGQTLEDAACLVFLESEFADFSAKTEPDKVVDILRKSWAKMSPAAREAAQQLSYGPAERVLLDRALQA